MTQKKISRQEVQRAGADLVEKQKMHFQGWLLSHSGTNTGKVQSLTGSTGPKADSFASCTSSGNSHKLSTHKCG